MLLFLATVLLAAEFQVGAYYPNWLQYSQFTPADVRYGFLTDVHYGYFVPSEDGSSLTTRPSCTPPFPTTIGAARSACPRICMS